MPLEHGRRLAQLLPQATLVEIPDRDSVFHVLYDLSDRYGIPGEWSLRTGVPYLNGGRVGHWRGIYDDKNRLMVMISFNQDIGDAWEWADGPQYPEKMAGEAIRIGVNYVVYAMTH